MLHRVFPDIGRRSSATGGALERAGRVAPCAGERGLSATRCNHQVVSLGGLALSVGLVFEAGDRDEDRATIFSDDDSLSIALADGAGGMAGGADAAERVIAQASRGGKDAVAALVSVDRELASASSGESTAVLLRLVASSRAGVWCVSGASVGDSRAWCRIGGRWIEATAEQRRRPFVGSGRCQPVAFDLDGVDAVLVVSDGLGLYADGETLCGLIDEAAANDRADIGRALVDVVRLPSGRLRDDVSAVVVRAWPGHPRRAGGPGPA